MKSNKIKVFFKKHGPTMLVYSGIGFVVGGTVLACKRTSKMHEVIEDTKHNIEEANSKLTNVNPVDEEYTEKENRKEIAKIYGKAAVNTAKVYALPTAISGTGIAMILGGHHIIKKRYVTIAGAYVTLNASYDAYRERVKAKIGEEEENKLYHNIVTEEVEVEGKNGKKKKVKKDYIKDASMYDVEYSKKTNPAAHEDVRFNPLTKKWEGFDLLAVEQANRILEARLPDHGDITLNDAHDVLDLSTYDAKKNKRKPYHTKPGSVVGWHYDPSDETRDSHIEIGWKPMSPKQELGEPGGIILTFNVDGVILDFLPEE